MMNLELVINSQSVTLKLPARRDDSPLAFALSSGSFMHDLPEKCWAALMKGQPLDVPLPLGAWRFKLRELVRSYDFARDPKNAERLTRRGGTAAKDEATSPADAGPLTFSVGGMTHDDIARIPAPGECRHPLGSFVLASGVMLVTDPCYEKDTWCAGELTTRTGAWHAVVVQRDNGVSGHRNAILMAVHESVELAGLTIEQMEETGIDVGVDSGQAGFFEKARYPDDKDQLEYEDGTWYAKVCELTLDESGPGAGITPEGSGVVSQTFWGDGGYPCFVKKDENGLVVAAAIVFDGSADPDEENEADEDSPN